jgi:hypothetical protein
MSDRLPTFDFSNARGMNIRGIIPSIVMNAVVPFVVYQVLKSYHASDLVALSAAGLLPAISTSIGIIRQRHVDLIGALALIGIGVNIVAVLIGGDPRILLIRESFLTGALGVACFVSLLFPRPLMFYFGRYFATGNNPAKREQYNGLWHYPSFRSVNRIITIVWGVAYVGEFISRAIMAYTLPIPVVLAVSPFLLGGITIVTVAWTIAYVRRSAQREADAP